MLQFNKRKQFYHAYRVIELLSFAFSEQALQAAFCSLYMHLREK